MKSILQAWVTELGLRHQGVLLTAVRGCDTWSKYSAEKPLIREMRGLILVAFDPRELEFAEGFMTRFPESEWGQCIPEPAEQYRRAAGALRDACDACGRDSRVQASGQGSAERVSGPVRAAGGEVPSLPGGCLRHGRTVDGRSDPGRDGGTMSAHLALNGGRG
jgi:hypothetical protein